MSPETKRIAAIDVGTNSIHMIVAEPRPGGYRVVDREKEMVQLGLSSLDGQPLTEEAMSRGVEAIARMRDIAARWKAGEIVAVATSAVREAPNRREFLRRVRENAGVRVKVISGEEEADYIYRAVRSAVDLDASTALCIDIGGGSVEFIVGTASEIFLTRSEPLGALRLSQRFALHGRPGPRSVAACRRHVAERVRKLRKRIRGLGIDLCVGTSGSILALTQMSDGNGNGKVASHKLKRLERRNVTDAVRTLASLSNSERVERFGFDERRASSIVAGAIVLDEIMDVLSIDSLLACPAAIREGIIESRVSAMRPAPDSGGSVRRASVVAFAARTECDLKHAYQVARLSVRIFDQTRTLHRLPAAARENLEHAALLHETGMHVSDRGHHKHTYYLVRHADLRGFTDDQLIIIANVARYYRKAPPDRSDENLAELTPAQRGEVEKLTAILRIAEALDRGHRQRVRDVGVRIGRGEVRFDVRTRSDASVEIASAAKRAKYFAALFEQRVKLAAAR
jgi:exopolyphosphatase/guanosine-5'-triphosphate,3'-diphosphate pyrophosphatase